MEITSTDIWKWNMKKQKRHSFVAIPKHEHWTQHK